MAGDIQIERQYEVFAAGRGGFGETRIRIEFTVGPDGPFHVELAKDGFSADVAHDQIQTLAEAIRRTRARTED